MNILINLLNIRQKHPSDPCHSQRLSQGLAKVAGKVALEAPCLCKCCCRVWGREWGERNPVATATTGDSKLLRRGRVSKGWSHVAQRQQEKQKALGSGNQAKSKGSCGRKDQADRDEVGWDAAVREVKGRENKSVQKDWIKADECCGTRLLISDRLRSTWEGAQPWKIGHLPGVNCAGLL